MNPKINKITEALKAINQKNALEDELTLLSVNDFPDEYKDLIEAVNDTITQESKKLQHKQKSLAIINNIIHSGMWSMEFDTDGEMTKVTWSDTFRHMLGFKSVEDFPNTLEAWSDRLHPDHKEKTLNAYWNTVAGNSYYDVEYLLKVKDGSYKWFRATGELDRREDGSPGIFVGTFIDINLQKENNRLREASLREKEANEAKTRFLSHMSHDIRTPINRILGMVTIGDLFPDDMQKQADCRKKVRATTQHLLSLINNVLDLSKLESGVSICQEEPFEITSLIDNCLAMIQPQADSSGIQIQYSPKPIQNPHIIGCSLYLRQILVNLLSNAIKYNRQNGFLFLELEENILTEDIVEFNFIVKDTGIGMSPDFLRCIFEPFTQENSGARTKFMGTGLGMSITKQLVDKMNGTINVSSEQNKGSTFSVCLPFAIDHDSQHAESDSETPKQNLKDICVLLVEDNDINLEIGHCILKHEGIKVIIAKDGQQAVDCFLNSEPYSINAILMDVMMPIMDGLEATRKIRRSGRKDAKTVPILAMTANAFSEDAEKTKQAGMNEHLTKPIDKHLLLQRLAFYCKKNAHPNSI